MIKHQKMVSHCCDRWAVHFVMPPAALSSHQRHWSSSSVAAGGHVTSFIVDVSADPKLRGREVTDSSCSRSELRAEQTSVTYAKLVCGLFHRGGTRQEQKKKKRHVGMMAPLVSGLVSPAGARCTVPPAGRGASSGSPRAAHRDTGGRRALKKHFVIAEGLSYSPAEFVQKTKKSHHI